MHVVLTSVKFTCARCRVETKTYRNFVITSRLKGRAIRDSAALLSPLIPPPRCSRTTFLSFFHIHYYILGRVAHPAEILSGHSRIMPRPAFNRRRQNSFNKFSPKRRGGQPDANAHREYLQKKLAKVAVGSKPENSDDSDGIVTSRASGRNRKHAEIYASGAVAKGDKPGAFPTRAQRTRALRGDTEEIVSQRSRSQSRAQSVASTNSTPANSLLEKEAIATVAKENNSAKRRKITDPTPKRVNAPPNVQIESSILGAIKPRKRQNSILETMGIGHDNIGLDSSAIHSDDEGRFLPDEISTPAQDPRQRTTSDGTKTTSSLKRKRDTREATSGASGRSSSSLSSVPEPQIAVPSTQPELPRPSRSQQRKLSTTRPISRIDEDVMAPPASSDSEDSVSEAEAPPVLSTRTKNSNPIAPSTQQLQNLMPSKRQKPMTASRPLDEFEIQEDSTANSDEDQQDHSSFSPVKNTRSRRKPAVPSKGKSQGKQKATGAAVNAVIAKTKNKAGTKSTRITPNTPSPTRLRTPLPISSSKSRRPEAKSPSKQDTIMRDKSTNTPLPAARATRGVRKQYGGSRHKEQGKENQPISLSDGVSDSDSGSVDQAKVKAARNKAKGPEIKAWTKKWGDIDDFKLEYEEVSVSTRSSSPNGMAR